jgi:teichuronic acid exporter
MVTNLKAKALRALLWSFLERVGQQGIQFVISIVLARLLVPEQFGLIAMLSIFMAVAQSFIDSGFGSALIQKADTTYLDECSVFYFNILVGCLFAGLLCLAAPGIALFYHTPILVPLTRLLSLNLVIGSFGIIQATLLTKRLDFKAQMKVSLIATLVSGAVGIFMAYRGYGVWSLVMQSLGGNFLRTLLFWLLLPWRPAWLFSITSLRCMFGFGSKLLFSGLLNTIFENLYLVIIGRTFSAVDLGFYARAKGIQQLPTQNICSTVGRVTFPLFSAMQDNEARLKHALRQALTTLAMVNFPLAVGLALVARPLVLTLLTDKWVPCVPYLQLLCLAEMLYPLHAINLNVLKAQGRSDLFFRLEVIKKGLVIVAIVVTYRWGILAMIVGQMVNSCISYYLNTHYTGKLVDYPVTEQIRDLLPSLALAGAMGGGVYTLRFVPFPNLFALLAAQIVAGVVLYVLLCRITQFRVFMECVEMIRPGWLRLRRAIS